MRDFIELISIYLLTLIIIVLLLSLLVITLDNMYSVFIEPLLNWLAGFFEQPLERQTYVADTI